MESEMMTIHVQLLGEGTPVWRPARALHLSGSIFELLGPQPEDEDWQFKPGQVVECQVQAFGGNDSGLVAMRALPPNNSFKPNPLRGSA